MVKIKVPERMSRLPMPDADDDESAGENRGDTDDENQTAVVDVVPATFVSRRI